MGGSPQDVARRLREIRRDCGDLSQNAFAKKLGISGPAYNNYEKAKRLPSPEALTALTLLTNVNITWLLTGGGPKHVAPGMSTVSEPLVADPGTSYGKTKSGLALLEEAAKLLKEEKLRAAEWVEKRVASGGVTVEAFFEILTPEEWKKSAKRMEKGGFLEQVAAVPLLADAAAAGSPRDVRDEDIESFALIYKKWVPNPKDTTCLPISGDSMEPTLADGSIVAVDSTYKKAEKLKGKIVAARIDGGVVVKRLFAHEQYILLASDNRDYEPIIMPQEEGSCIIGKIIWSWSRFQ